MDRRFMWIGLLAVLGAGLGGCATMTPDFRSNSQTAPEQWLSQQHLIFHIQCQLANAVAKAEKFDQDNAVNVPPERRAAWLGQWGAKVSLVLSVNNKNNFSPSLSATTPLENAVTVFTKNGNVTTGQNRSLGLGFSWSADATRTETIGFYYSFEDLKKLTLDPTKCKPNTGPYLASDLKIDDFLMKGLDMSFQPDALLRKDGESPYTTFTYQVKFIVTTGGNLTPAWKLVELSANQSGNLFAASQIKTDELTITMGKVVTDDKGNKVPRKDFDDQHFANLVGQAVANALQTRPPL
ncbi:hypothetical protein A7E77_07035 [Sphingomonas sp. NIC1]|nr:hypothetical protein A7E77_07035 [Sphingomonas sp. NIC1]